MQLEICKGKLYSIMSENDALPSGTAISNIFSLKWESVNFPSRIIDKIYLLYYPEAEQSFELPCLALVFSNP
ncbi:hypothetical protein GDO78_004224 [Eleutherodactylus coqui]|uniref:Uncharacterized protein n=1 Tax=Eleutherodactylus coqui TaxID=57060 RepID=A0A8J6ERZ8_ELECQ|nr:hypothetical protein GDO78_004224 [Eleutherodactylus coqui]